LKNSASRLLFREPLTYLECGRSPTVREGVSRATTPSLTVGLLPRPSAILVILAIIGSVREKDHEPPPEHRARPILQGAGFLLQSGSQHHDSK